MNEKKSLQDICGRIANDAGVSKSTSEKFLRLLFDIIEKSLQEDGIAKVPELGTFKLITVDERKSVNVRTGEDITIPSYQKVTFTPVKELKEKVNKPYAHLTTYVVSKDGPVDPPETEDEEEETDSKYEFVSLDTFTSETQKESLVDKVEDEKVFSPNETSEGNTSEKQIIRYSVSEETPINEQENNSEKNNSESLNWEFLDTNSSEKNHDVYVHDNASDKLTEEGVIGISGNDDKDIQSSIKDTKQQSPQTPTDNSIDTPTFKASDRNEENNRLSNSDDFLELAQQRLKEIIANSKKEATPEFPSTKGEDQPVEICDNNDVHKETHASVMDSGIESEGKKESSNNEDTFVGDIANENDGLNDGLDTKTDIPTPSHDEIGEVSAISSKGQIEAEGKESKVEIGIGNTPDRNCFNATENEEEVKVKENSSQETDKETDTTTEEEFSEEELNKDYENINTDDMDQKDIERIERIAVRKAKIKEMKEKEAQQARKRIILLILFVIIAIIIVLLALWNFDYGNEKGEKEDIVKTEESTYKLPQEDLSTDTFFEETEETEEEHVMDDNEPTESERHESAESKTSTQETSTPTPTPTPTPAPVSAANIHSFDPVLINYMNTHHPELKFPASVPVAYEYTVKDGSRLAQCSRNIYNGVFHYWVYLYFYNRDVLRSPNDLRAGLVLKVPDLGNKFVDPSSNKCKQLANEIQNNLLE